MGAITAAGFADSVAHGQVSLERALSYHLTANHYPPVPTALVPACIAAIAAYNEEDYFAPIDLPEGVTWRNATQAPAHAVVEQHHLDAFIVQDDDDEEGI